jgi:hypothetical protein
LGKYEMSGRLWKQACINQYVMDSLLNSTAI